MSKQCRKRGGGLALERRPHSGDVHQGKNPDCVTLGLIDQAVVLVRCQLAGAGNRSQSPSLRKVSKGGRSRAE